MGISLSYIYLIKCPKTGTVRYVGQTSSPRTRFVQHISAAVSGNSKNVPLSEWVNSLIADGLKPVFEVVKLCLNENASAMEKSIYYRYSGSGMLLNQKSLHDDHSEIDYKLLKLIAKEKRLKNNQIAKACGLPAATVGCLFRGKTNEVKIWKARILEKYLLSLIINDTSNNWQPSFNIVF